MNVSYGKRANIIVVLIIVANFSLPHVSESSQECKGWLVQSIPTDMPHLPRVPGVLSTGMFNCLYPLHQSWYNFSALFGRLESVGNHKRECVIFEYINVFKHFYHKILVGGVSSQHFILHFVVFAISQEIESSENLL